MLHKLDLGVNSHKLEGDEFDKIKQKRAEKNKPLKTSQPNRSQG